MSRDFAIFDNLTDLVVVLDDTGTIIYGNPYAGELLGRTLDDTIGTSIADYLHPDDLVRALEVMSFITTDQMVVPVTPALYRLRCHDGSWCPVEINGNPLPADSDESAPILIVGRYSGDRHLQDQILEMLTTGEPFPEIIALVPEFGRWRHPHEHYAVFTHDIDGIPARAGSQLATRLAHEHEDDPDTPWARAASTGEEVIVETPHLPGDLRTIAQAEGLLACWAVPVTDPLSTEPAVIVAWSRDHGPATSVHRYSLETMARALTLTLQWRAQVADLQRAASQDALTGVVNRSGFFAHLAAAPAPRGGTTPAPTRSAVLYVDLDGFKAVNDAHGHTVGDAVLSEIAARIQGVVRRGDILARLGGDEFAVLCPVVEASTDAIAVAERIIEVTGEPLTTVGAAEPILVGASVGISVARTGSIEPDALVDLADRALYRAKAAGRGQWSLSEPDHPDD